MRNLEIAEDFRQLKRELAGLAGRLTFKRGRHQGNSSTLVQFWVDDGDPISFGAVIDAALKKAAPAGALQANGMEANPQGLSANDGTRQGYQAPPEQGENPDPAGAAPINAAPQDSVSARTEGDQSSPPNQPAVAAPEYVERARRLWHRQRGLDGLSCPTKEMCEAFNAGYAAAPSAAPAQNAELVKRLRDLSTLVYKGKYFEACEAMLLAADALSEQVPVYDEATIKARDQAQNAERSPTNTLDREPDMRIDGCRHTLKRMVEWVDNGACPICAVATAGMLREKLAGIEAITREVLECSMRGYLIDEGLHNRIEAAIARQVPAEKTA